MESHVSTCYKCEFQCDDQQKMRDHEVQKHMYGKFPELNHQTTEEAVSCTDCDETFDKELSLEWHIETHHQINSDFKCSVCNFAASSQYSLDNHMEETHVHKCDKCTQIFQSYESLTKHQPTHQTDYTIESQTNCDQCDYKGNTATEFITHLLETHKSENLLECSYCEFKTNNREEHKKHIEAKHVDFAMFGHIAMNQDALTNNFEHFKTELTSILNVIIDSHNTMKQELFILRQNEHASQQKLKAIQDLLLTISSDVTSKQQKEHSNTFPSDPPMPVPPVPEPKKTFSKTRTCFIGDSITANLDRKMLEHAMDSEVVTARAYSSLESIEENEAKEKTRYPHKSFSNVINAELMKAETDILVIQSGSVDITNMKTTNDNLEKYGEYFKQEAVLAATNLFTAVTNALVTNTSVKKAVIMKNTPRYDTKASDPHSVKSALSLLYNDTLVQLWLSSPHKNRIVIGSHNLDCVGGVRESRYGSKSQYDGVHMHGASGKKAYNESVLEIIRDAQLIQKSPPLYFRRFHKSKFQTKPSVQSADEYVCPTQETDWMNDVDIRNKTYKQRSTYSVPTSNRFSNFSSLNY